MKKAHGPAVIVIGAGGHAKVVIELIRAEGKFEIAGCTDAARVHGSVLEVPVLGSDELLADLWQRGIRHAFPALGDNQTRMLVAERVRQLNYELINAISPNALISPSASCGAGIAIMSGAIINACTRICDLAIINTGAIVDHDCIVGIGAHVGPGSTLAGSVTVGAGAFIGAGTSVIPGITIGDYATVGAGSAVVRDVPPRAKVAGVPARELT